MGTFMPVMIVIGLSLVFGALTVAYCMISFASRRDDHALGSLRFDAPNHRARTARAVMGISSSRWD